METQTTAIMNLPNIEGELPKDGAVVFTPWAHCFDLGPQPKIEATYTGVCPFETDEQAFSE